MTRSKKVLTTSEDHKMGERLKALRVIAGFSQTELGKRLPDRSISFQQIQKYEKGQNRIPATRLRHFAAILGVPITYFYEDGNRYLELFNFDKIDVELHHFLKSIPQGRLRLGLAIILKALSELKRNKRDRMERSAILRTLIHIFLTLL